MDLRRQDDAAARSGFALPTARRERTCTSNGVTSLPLPGPDRSLPRVADADDAILLLGTLSLLGIVIIGNFGQVFFLLGITDEKCH